MSARGKLSGSRRGFALLAVLWVLTGVAVLSLATTLAAREAFAGARNRAALTRAAWHAEGCVAAARAAIGAALESELARRGSAGDVWRTLDRIAPTSPLWPRAGGCDAALVPAGARVDLNAAPSDQLRALFAALDIGADRADSLADALLDWCDADDLARPRGAERGWYAERGRAAPRDGPLADVGELARVRGFDPATIGAVRAVAWVEPGRLSLSHAPPAALASLPGFGHEAVARLLAMRDGGRLVDVPTLAAGLSREGAAELAGRLAELGVMQTPEPDAWILTAAAGSGMPRVVATVELRLVRAGARAAVVQRRGWP